MTLCSPKSAVLPPWKEGGMEAAEEEEAPDNVCVVRNGLLELVFRSSELRAAVKGSWYGGGGGRDGGGKESTVLSEVC